MTTSAPVILETMHHANAAEIARHGATTLSRLLKAGRIPQGDKEEVADLAIDLSLLAKHHATQAIAQEKAAAEAQAEAGAKG